MKQIFEWLREQIGDRKENYSSITMIDVNRVHNIIDEAEAKWEAECCEWRISEFADEWMPVCRNGKCFRLRGVRKYKFCPYCGKPIKISEVE